MLIENNSLTYVKSQPKEWNFYFILTLASIPRFVLPQIAIDTICENGKPNFFTISFQIYGGQTVTD